MHKVFQRLLFPLTLCSHMLVGVSIHEGPLPDSLEQLQSELKEIVSRADEEAQIGVHIVSVDKGKTLFEKHASHRFIPAAAVKLLTAGAALQKLGPSFCFETTLSTDGEIVDGVLKGDLYLTGSGDPSLISHSLEDLIFQLKLQNIHKIEGDLVFDSSEFDELSLAPGWMWDEKLECRNGPVEALTVNHSCIKIWLKPVKQKGLSPFVHIEPELPGLIIENNAKIEDIEPAQNTLTVEKKEQEDSDVLCIGGCMSPKSSILEFSVPVKRPSLYVATEFSVILKNHHIKQNGKMRFEKTPLKVKRLANHLSESLFHLVMHMLKNNDNLYANCFFKKIGAMKYAKPGTWPTGSRALHDFLSSIDNKDWQDSILLDGSGESRYNMISPKAMTSFLCSMYRQFSPEFIASIPVAGIDEALNKRLKDKIFKGKVRVLPGALQGVSSLTGYVTTLDGEVLAMSVMINGSQKFSKAAKKDIEDRICQTLTRYSLRG